MTESTICSINNTTGIENSFIHPQADENVRIAKCSVRPSGIPRLSSSISHRQNHDSITEDCNIKTKIPVSPTRINEQMPKSTGNYAKSPSQDLFMRDVLISPTYSKRTSRDTFVFNHCVTSDPRIKTAAQSLNRRDRAVSEEHQGRKSVESSFSEMTNNSGSTGASNHVITSKIGSFANARHKPGGGNVKIIEKKVDFSNVEARCGSRKNIKHKPGGGDIEIVNRKLEFSKIAESKVNSLKNIKYQPQGGDVKIDDRKLEWNTTSKVGSLNNMKHKPGGGSVQIVNQQLPWLKYNKPNLPPEEISKIQKKSYKDHSAECMGSPPRSYSNSQISDHSQT